MKKLFLMMGAACLFMVACNNAPKQQEVKEEAPVVEEQHECPMGALMAEYANWDNMDETAKAELNKKAMDLFAEMDAKMAEMAEGKPCCKEGEEHKCNHEGEEGHKCNHEGEHQCQHQMPELTEEQKAECEAKCAEMKAKWDAFETLTVDEQKDLIMGRIECMKKHHECHHEGEEGHQCQHEGEGHQCQHGEGHECQHGK